MHDAAGYIGLQAKAIMSLINELDPDMPDEDLIEVLIGMVGTWGVIEAQVLFPALETAFEGAEESIAPARERLNALYALQNVIHASEGADKPLAELVRDYVDAVKYHLVVDIQDIAPLAAALPQAISMQLAASMAAMKRELE